MDTTDEVDTSLKFQFTRHGYSCNNAANMFSKEFEPSIHPFAIEQLDKEKNVKDGKHRFEGDDFDFETFNQPESQRKGIHVFVSPLIRTWETALLLYSQENLDASGIDLYVSPYLKEMKQFNIRKGNFPQNPKIIMNKFLNFINIPEVKSLINNIETICIHWPQNINVSKIDSIGMEMKEIKFTRNRETVGGVGEEQPPKTIEGTVSIIIKPDFIISEEDNPICSFQNIKDILSLDFFSIFLQEGNLSKFMENFEIMKSKYPNNDNLVINKNEEQIVHVVTHSNIMRKHLLETYGVNINYKQDENSVNYSKYEKYNEANNWSFTDKREKISEVTEDNVIGKLDFKIGVPGEHGDEINNKDYGFQTCGVPNKSLCTFWSTPKGGKKTKKKRKNKRTHKKKNAHKKRKTHNKRKN